MNSIHRIMNVVCVTLLLLTYAHMACADPDVYEIQLTSSLTVLNGKPLTYTASVMKNGTSMPVTPFNRAYLSIRALSPCQLTTANDYVDIDPNGDATFLSTSLMYSYNTSHCNVSFTVYQGNNLTLPLVEQTVQIPVVSFSMELHQPDKVPANTVMDYIVLVQKGGVPLTDIGYHVVMMQFEHGNTCRLTAPLFTSFVQNGVATFEDLAMRVDSFDNDGRALCNFTLALVDDSSKIPYAQVDVTRYAFQALPSITWTSNTSISVNTQTTLPMLVSFSDKQVFPGTKLSLSMNSAVSPNCILDPSLSLSSVDVNPDGTATFETVIVQNPDNAPACVFTIEYFQDGNMAKYNLLKVISENGPAARDDAVDDSAAAMLH